MRCGEHRIAVLAAVILTVGVMSATADDVLYWMVDGNTQIDIWWEGSQQSVYDYCVANGYPDSEFAARVRVVGGDITEDTFLKLYWDDGFGHHGFADGEWGVDLGDSGSGYWGAGVPTGNQSPVQDYSAGSPEYSFILELGNISGDDWTTVATSEAVAYSRMPQDYIHPSYGLTPSALQIWTPSLTAVPEPSGGMLMMLGLALLALRRKRLSEGA